MSKFDITTIKGVIPAMVTTFDENEEVDLKRGRDLVRFLIDAGVHGLYITGSTGEGFLMTGEERKSFCEAVIDEVKGRIPVIVHVGDIGTKKSIDLAKHAEQAGADAISSVPPFYYRFNGDDIYNYYKDISESVSIPMIVYNISLAGLMSNALVKRIASVDNVKGLKFTGREHDDMCALKQELGSDFMIYSGCDEMATQGLLAGADGLIGSTYNLMPDTAIEMYNLTQKGDYVGAFEIQKIATKLIHFITQWDFFPIMKNLITSYSVDAGYSRRPFAAPSKELMSKINSFCLNLKEEHKGQTHIAFIDRM
ncbi:MAG: dihydrodipicolinate synthase family protein [Spirochaetia bacterium]|nr:dihydrodipicolinate synthase family protein [Spirochaetia bacterium]